MEDQRIVELYWQRNETALKISEDRYTAYCFQIAYNILGNVEDAKESVNDVWFAAWRSIPPHRPKVLQSFLGKLTRNISLKKRRYQYAQKRGGGELSLVYNELDDIIPARNNVEDEVETMGLSRCIDQFLDTLPAVEQRVFLKRYWYFESIHTIAKQFHFSDAKVKSMLHRIRKKLADTLQKEEFYHE